MWGGSSACATLERYVIFVQDCKSVRKRGEEGEEPEACSVHDFTNSTYVKGGVKFKQWAKTSDHMLKLVVSCCRLSLK